MEKEKNETLEEILFKKNSISTISPLNLPRAPAPPPSFRGVTPLSPFKQKIENKKSFKRDKRILQFLSEQADLLANEPECKGRIPDDIFLSLRFTDGHIHHLTPEHIPPIEMIKDFLALENTSLEEISKIPVKEPTINKRPIIFKNRQAIGDILMFSCAIRDFAKKYPDWPINVSSTVMHLWDNNPYIDRTLTPENAEIVEIGPGFLTNASNRDDRHFANAFRLSIEEKLKISIPQGPICPDIWMTKEEISAKPIVEPPYWIIVAGEKGDWTAKTYPFARWEEFVNMHPEITFVQIGASEHRHPHLDFPNVVNLIGKTQDRNTGFRDLLKLFYHAEGSMGLVSFQMHLAAAFNLPCVTIAGAREPARFTRYPGHQYLCTDGCLPCAERTACWHCDLEKTCKYIVEKDGQRFPQCVDIISVEDLNRAFLQYYTGGRLSPTRARIPVLPNPVQNVDEKKIHPTPVARKLDQTIPGQWGMEWGGGSITDLDYAFLQSIIETYNIKTVLEFGTGLSTLLFNQLGLDVETYETNQGWIDKIKAFNPSAKVNLWNGKDLEINKEYDFVFVDGPAGGANREFSTRIASLVSNKIIVHDAGREFERQWQDKYLKGDFDLASKGGHRCHFWVKKTSEQKKLIFENKPKIEFLKEQKLVTVVFNGRGEGGAEKSTTWIMNRLIEKGINVRYIHPGPSPSGTFRKEGNRKVHTTNNLDLIKEPCDALFLYSNDWVWEFPKDEVAEKFKDLQAKRKVLAVNYRIGKIGGVPWTQDWDQYLFLNSSLQEAFQINYFKAKTNESMFSFKTNVLPPPTDLEKFYQNEANYSGKLRLIRHNSQGDAKYPKNFNEIVKRILENVPEIEIHLMPGPSFLENFGDRVKVYQKNVPPVNEFLRNGNCFWYILPEGYTEGAGKVIMEAQASGLPCIVDNHSGPKEWVPGSVGMTCDNVDDHIVAIEVMSAEYTRKMFGQRAKDFAKETYNPENWITKILGE